MKRKCGKCKFFEEKIPKDTNRSYTIIGRCRLHAPMVGKGYPQVYPSDWCGDYREDENKI